MATTMANSSSMLLQVIAGLKYLQLGYVQRGGLSILQRSLWSGTVSGVKDIHTSRESKTFFPEKPKQPANVFILFTQKMTPQIEKANPGLKRTEIIQQISKMWNELDPEEKSRLAMERREAFEKYKEDLRVYMDNLTPEQMMEAERKKREKIAKTLKKTRRSLGMPNKPSGAYNYFVSEKFQDRSDEPVQTYFKQVLELWRRLSDSEKQKYYGMAEEQKRQYEIDIANWEKEMMALGRYDVIRKTSLKQIGTKKRRRSPRSSSVPKDDHEL